MAAEQVGQVGRYRGVWCARWYDEHGKRRRRYPFETKTAARKWVNRKVEEVEKLRRGELVLGGRTTPPTVRELVDEFLAQYAGEQNSKTTLANRLKHVTGSEPDDEGKRRIQPASFSDLLAERLTLATVAAWRRKLPAGSAWHVHKALRQVLNYGVAAGYLERNVARDVPNPQPKRKPIVHFDTPAEIDALAEELDEVSASAIVFASESGLRTEEWLALERPDLEIAADRKSGVVHVRRVYTAGRVKEHGKTSISLRTVPLTARAIAAVDRLTRRIDTPILFAAVRGGPEDCGRCAGGRCYHIDLHWWRGKVWNPGLRAAGLDIDEHGVKLKRTPYSLRHTYATWMLAANVPGGDVAEFMGTSLEQLDATYRHRSADAHTRAAKALAAWQARSEAAAGEASS